MEEKWTAPTWKTAPGRLVNQARSAQIEVQKTGFSGLKSGLQGAQERSIFTTKARAYANAARIMFLTLELT